MSIINHIARAYEETFKHCNGCNERSTTSNLILVSVDLNLFMLDVILNNKKEPNIGSFFYF